MAALGERAWWGMGAQYSRLAGSSVVADAGPECWAHLRLGWDSGGLGWGAGPAGTAAALMSQGHE